MPSDLISTREAPGEFDALTTLREGEPYFALVGRDRLAPPLVQQWADDNRRRALADFEAGRIDAERRDRELRKSSQAEAIGWAMQAYKAGHEQKKAQEASSRPTYTGHELPQETKRSDALQSARIRAAAAIHNAIAEAQALLDIGDDFDNGTVRFGLIEMRKIADMIEPERPIP